jgi:hypothetical protein
MLVPIALAATRPLLSQASNLDGQFFALEIGNVGKLIARQLAGKSERKCEIADVAISTNRHTLEAICSSTGSLCFWQAPTYARGWSTVAVVVARNGGSILARVSFDFAARVLALRKSGDELTLCFLERHRTSDFVRVAVGSVRIPTSPARAVPISRVTELGEFFEPKASLGGDSIAVVGYGPNSFRAWKGVSLGKKAPDPFLEGPGNFSVSPDGKLFAVFLDGEAPKIIDGDRQTVARLESDIKPGIIWIGNNDTALRVRPKVDASIYFPAAMEVFSIRSGEVYASCACRPILGVSGYLAFAGHWRAIEKAVGRLEASVNRA